MEEPSPRMRFSKPVGAFLIGLSAPFFAAIFFTVTRTSQLIDLAVGIVLLLVGLFLVRLKI